MPKVAIVLARTKGGLSGVAEASGLVIINGTETKHSGVGTFYEDDANPGDVIDSETDGWIGLATEA